MEQLTIPVDHSAPMIVALKAWVAMLECCDLRQIMGRGRHALELPAVRRGNFGLEGTSSPCLRMSVAWPPQPF